jgi:hypothetical protein
VTEPHVNIWRFGACVACGAADSWVVIAVPQVATGVQYPQFGVCEECGHDVDLHDLPPFVVDAETGERVERHEREHARRRRRTQTRQRPAP